VIGALAAPPSYYAIVWRARTRVDDSLDVFAGHGVGGIVGALLTGVLADPAWGPGRGLLYGNPSQLALQALGVVSALVYSAAVTFVLLRALSAATSLRAVPRAQGVGMDVSQHGEEAYGSGEGAVLLTSDRASASVGATVGTLRA
jgi:Amt family ammonium transporter